MGRTIEKVDVLQYEKKYQDHQIHQTITTKKKTQKTQKNNFKMQNVLFPCRDVKGTRIKCVSIQT